MMTIFRAVDLIDRKRQGGNLSQAEIDWLVSSYVNGRLPDYQMAALLMAIAWRGMTPDETANLTRAMAISGATLDLSDVAPVVVDKHSTGGVGDKTTLIVAPIVAACGVYVGKMTGRGLGHTGGTVDKLESIPGFSSNLDAGEFKHILREHRLVLAGQSTDLAPADGLIYALRDATATVQSIPLIASSIMAKKLASGSTHILLDVKVGRGAFVQTLAEARELAHLMLDIGVRAGRTTEAVLSNMEQPLGYAVGNALELSEAIATLRGEGPPDLTELCFHEAATLLHMAGKAATHDEGLMMARQAVTSGAALAKLADVVAAQGGAPEVVYEHGRLPTAPVRRSIPAPAAACVQRLDALRVGQVAMRLGAGRQQKGDAIDHRVGVMLHAKVGDRVQIGQPLATLYAATNSTIDAVQDDLLAAFAWSDTPVEAPPIILDHLHPARRDPIPSPSGRTTADGAPKYLDEAG